VNEPLRHIKGTFFGEIQDVPMDYLIRTLQSHDWGHCKCTGDSLCYCNQIGLENSECICSVPGQFRVSTLSISLQCICNVPDWDTTFFPQ
jgi:hypothetical protein